MTLTKEQKRKLSKRALNEAYKMPEEVLKCLIGYELTTIIVLIFLRLGIGLEFSNPDSLIGLLCAEMLFPSISVIISFFDIYKKLKKEEEEIIQKVKYLDGFFYQGDNWVTPKQHKEYYEFFENLSSFGEIRYFASFIKEEKTIKIFITIDNKPILFEEIKKEDFLDFYKIGKPKLK